MFLRRAKKFYINEKKIKSFSTKINNNFFKNQNFFFKTLKIVISDALFNNNDIDFLRFQKRRNIVIKMLKHYEFSQSKNDELIVISSKLIFEFKKRIQITHIFINNENDIQTSINKFKFAIKF